MSGYKFYDPKLCQFKQKHTTLRRSREAKKKKKNCLADRIYLEWHFIPE